MDFATAAKQSGAMTLKTSIRDSDRFSFDGGLNLMDDPMTVEAGQLLGSLNYEPGIRGGYRRFDGYERFDGRPSPSDTAFVAIEVIPTYVPPIGSTITESGSGASGVVFYVDTLNHFVCITLMSGQFVGRGSILTVAGYGASITLSSAYLDGGLTDGLANEYYLQKYLYLQSSISTVGGIASSGPVRGAWPYLDTVYAFRDNAAGTHADMWKSTSAGWVQVPLGIKIRYEKGIYKASMNPPPEGTILTGATSGATITIKRLATLKGTWGTDAAGYLIGTVTGTPVANEHMQVAGVTWFDYLSQSSQVLPPGGIYEFRNHNFNANQDPDTGFRMYGINRVGNGFEYDAYTNTFVLIETGMDDDRPQHMEIHNDHMFYAYPGGSLQNSGFQYPLSWNPVFGADARSVGEDVTFLREDVSNTLIIGTRRRVWMLTGDVLENFQIKVYAANTGSIERTDEMPGQIIFMEDRGFTTVAAAQQYGNFAASSLSDKILDTCIQLMESDVPVGAVVTRKKNLYRIIFESGTVLCLSINAQGKFGGWLQGAYPDKPYAFFGGFSQPVTAGKQVERAFLCGDNGYVYELDKGRSFDGKNVPHFLRMSYYDSRSPDRFKRYRRLLVNLAPEGPCSIMMSVDYDYGNRSGQLNQTLDFTGNGGFWDVDSWDRFVWDAAKYTQAIMKIEGEGYNIGLFFAGNGNNDAPATLYSASLQWSARVVNRNTKES